MTKLDCHHKNKPWSLTQHVSDAGAGQGPAADHPLGLDGGAGLGRELRHGGVQPVQRPAHPPHLGLGVRSETEHAAVITLRAEEAKGRKLNVGINQCLLK